MAKKRKPTTNPLVKYMKEHGITQDRMALILSSNDLGVKIYQPTVSAWATGGRVPGLSSRALMESATGGKVTRRMWSQWLGRRDG